MSRRLLRLALVIACLHLTQACESSSDEYDPSSAGQSTALFIDHQSLPAHRHAESVDLLQRRFLAMQSPGDRMILANNPSGKDDNSLLTITLPNRPLPATRVLRKSRELLDEGRDAEWPPEHHVPALASAQLDALEPPRCLYLAVDPDFAPIPSLPDGLNLDDHHPASFTAFLFTPEPSDPDRVSVWTRHLHSLGAVRVMRQPLKAELPDCW